MTLFLAIAGAPVEVGRSSAAALRILHPTVSRHHATVKRVGVNLLIEDHDSRFGTFVNGARVRVMGLVPGDRVQFGTAPAYRVEEGGLRLDIAAGGLKLSIENLAISVPGDPASSLGRQFIARQYRCDQPLIDKVAFNVEADSFVGILGPSGVGKSTILNCLASYLPPARGRVLFDGDRDVYVEPDALRVIMGHVPQDDILFRLLTTRENLTFAARLRLGTVSGRSQAEAVDQALTRVGLTEKADQPAGLLSGGQRKRLSVAIELLRRPRLLALDEPTSGLDPASEAHLMEQLRQVARQGTTVICTTHMMDNLHLLDSLVVLGLKDRTGRVAYVGEPAGLLSQFDCRGFADLYEILATGRFDPENTNRDSSPVMPPGALAGQSAEPTPSLFPEPGSLPSSARSLRSTGIAELTAGLRGDPGCAQLPLVAERALRQLLRDPVLVLAVIAQPVVLGLLVVLTQYDVAKPFPILFFAVVIAIWLGLNNSARDLVRERRQYVRDRLAGLRPIAYLGAKTLVHALLGLAQIAVLLVILHVGCSLVLDRPVYQDLRSVSLARLMCVLLLSYLGGVGLGFLASILVRTEEAAVAMLPMLIIPQLLLSAVAAGVQTEPYTKPRPFRPLVVTLMSQQDMPKSAVLVDLLSIGCFSRPAALVAEAPPVNHFGSWIWLGDFCHLLILLLGTWILVILAFQISEPRWLRLIGL